MNSGELTWQTSGGRRLPIRQWDPVGGTPAAAVVLVHGMGEHSGRYKHVGAFLGNRQAAVFAYDQRGHGHAEGKRGHARYEELLEDVLAMLELARERYPGVPLFLYGHSMGGNVVLGCALRYKPDVAGIVVSSPWLRLAFDPPSYKIALGRLVARLWPSFTMATGLHPADLYRGNLGQGDDGLVHGRISAGLFEELRQAGEEALSNARELHVPILLQHGTADNITSYGASEQLAREAPAGAAIEFRCWNDSFHELHNDLQQEQVLEHVARWIAERADAAARSGKG